MTRRVYEVQIKDRNGWRAGDYDALHFSHSEAMDEVKYYRKQGNTDDIRIITYTQTRIKRIK